MQKEKRYQLINLILMIFMVQGCASYKLDAAQKSIRKSFAEHHLSETQLLLQKYRDHKIYKSKDIVLYKLEMGSVYHFAGQYDSSFVMFHEAESEINRLFTKSIARGLSSILINDNQLAYDGEDYESIYLNTFNCLNFMHQSKYDEALVEARRVVFKLQHVNVKYKGLLETLSHADTTGKVIWKSGKSNVQNSALAHYLSGILYAKSGRLDDSRIEYEQLLKSFGDQPRNFTPEDINFNDLKHMMNPDSFNVLLISFTGRSPYKYQVDSRILIPDEDFYLKLSLPALHLVPSVVKSVYATIDDSLSVPLNLIENMDEVAFEVYKVKEPIIYARTFLRAFMKAMGTRYAERKVKKKGNKVLSAVISLAGFLTSEATEKADLRSWQTMPGKAYVKLVKLTKGKHVIRIDYIGYNGRLLYSEFKQLNIQSGEKLSLSETLFWN